MLVLTSLAKYKESAGGHTRQENMQQAKRMTEQLARRIPTLEQVEVGLNLTNQPLPTDFDSSSRFVNGVLGAIVAQQAKATPAPNPAQEL